MSRKEHTMEVSRLRYRPVKTFEISRKLQYFLCYLVNMFPPRRVRNLAPAGKLWVKNSDIFTGRSKQTATDKSVGGLG